MDTDVVGVLPVLPWTVGAVLLLLFVALVVPPPKTVPEAAVRSGSWTTTRVGAGLALLLTAVLAGLARLGPADELSNPASSLVVGLGPPALFVLPLLLAARAPRTDAAELDVRAAVPVAVALAGYFALVPDRGRPGLLAAALAGYAVVLLAVGLALGRAALRRCEPVGLLAAWVALGPRLVRWDPPRGATAVLAVVLGAAWFERWSRTAAWAAEVRDRPDLMVLLAVTMAGAAGLATALHRWAGSAMSAAALLPLAAGAVVACGLRRAVISGQLLLQQAGLREGIDPDPLGIAGGQGAALAVVVLAGCLSAAVVARRSAEGAARLPAAMVSLAVSVGSAVVVLQV